MEMNKIGYDNEQERFSSGIKTQTKDTRADGNKYLLMGSYDIQTFFHVSFSLIFCFGVLP